MKTPTKLTLEKGASFIIENKDYFQDISRAALYNDEPQIYHYSVIFNANKNHIHDSNDEPTTATGFSFNKKKALMKLFGETIERTALEIYPDNLPYESFKKKNFAINPLDFSPFSSTQINSNSYKGCRINADDKFYWVRGYSCREKKSVYIPAQLVYVPFHSSKQEPFIREQISSGAATGMTLEDAAYRGLCEIIERDSFMIGYLNKLPFPKIDVEAIKNDEIQGVLEQLKRYSLDFFVINTTTDIKIPSVATLIFDTTGKGPSVSIGLKAGFNVIDVIVGSIEEALQSRSWLRDAFFYKSAKKDIKQILSFEDRSAYWFPVEMIKEFNFWIKNTSKQKIEEIPTVKKEEDFFKEALRLVLEHSDIYYVDITQPKARELGFSVIKTLATSLYPLYLDEALKYLGVKRLYDVPVKLGYFDKPLLPKEFNTVPHPML